MLICPFFANSKTVLKFSDALPNCSSDQKLLFLIYKIVW